MRHASTRFLCFTKGLAGRVSEKSREIDEAEENKSICKEGNRGGMCQRLVKQEACLCLCARGWDCRRGSLGTGELRNGSLLCGTPPMALLTRCRIGRIAAVARPSWLAVRGEENALGVNIVEMMKEECVFLTARSPERRTRTWPHRWNANFEKKKAQILRRCFQELHLQRAIP